MQQEVFFKIRKLFLRKAFIFWMAYFENDRLGEFLLEHKMTFVFSSGFSLIASFELHPNLDDPLCL